MTEERKKPGPKPKTHDSEQPQNMTPEEAAIFQRVKSEGKSWTGLTEADVEDFSLMADPFELPPEAKKRFDQKQFAFRWAEKKAERLDMLRNADIPLRWWIANATTTPYLKAYCDPIHGGIQKLDQILLVKPFWMLQKVRDAKTELAEVQARGGDLKQRHKTKIDETGSEWLAGDQYKIDSGDEVMAEYEGDDGETSSGFGDFVVNE